MIEIKLGLEEEFLAELKAIGIPASTPEDFDQLINNALNLFLWTKKQEARGEYIASVKKNPLTQNIQAITFFQLRNKGSGGAE